MRHLGLFEGIGGFSLAASIMGWETVAWCEWDPFCQKVLKYHFPNAIPHDDITKTDFTIYRGTIDVLSGGFPCQPYSVAGMQLGKEDPRHLWPHMFRAAREIRPRWIVGENVFGIVNWGGGLVFEEVQADLEAEGYEVQPFVLPACGINAPHKRDRVFFIGHSKGEQSTYQPQQPQVGNKKQGEFGRRHSKISSPYSERFGQQRQGRAQESFGSKTYGNWEASWSNTNGGWPIESPICNGNDGISSRLDLTAISKKDWLEQSLKAGGNAIVPQLAIEIFKAINEYEKLN